MNLNIENPDLKIKSFSSTSQEKENIKNIYSEIDKEGKVLKIQDDKDKKYKEIKENLKQYRTDYSNFVKKKVPKTIERIVKEERKRKRRQLVLKEEPVFRIRRFSRDGKHEEEFNILEHIKPINTKNKEAIIEFYKSYINSAEEQKRLLKELGEIDEIAKKYKTIDTAKFKENLSYFEESGWSKTKIDLSKNRKSTPPETLLSKSLLDLMSNKWKDLEWEVENFGYDISFHWCNFVHLVPTNLSGENPCGYKIQLWRKDQATLENTIEFTMLLKLLKDMKQSQVQRFDIVYSQN